MGFWTPPPLGFWGFCPPPPPFGIWGSQGFGPPHPPLMGFGGSAPPPLGFEPIFGIWGFWTPPLLGCGVLPPPPYGILGCCAPFPPLSPPQAVERVLFPHLPSYGASLQAVLDDNSVSNAQVKAEGQKVYGAILGGPPPHYQDPPPIY